MDWKIVNLVSYVAIIVFLAKSGEKDMANAIIPIMLGLLPDSPIKAVVTKIKEKSNVSKG